jgi:nucleoside-diphosphate-sugar epimerase
MLKNVPTNVLVTGGSGFIGSHLCRRLLDLDGSQTRSFCYIDDLIDGLIALLNSPRGPPGPCRRPESAHGI